MIDWKQVTAEEPRSYEATEPMGGRLFYMKLTASPRWIFAANLLLVFDNKGAIDETDVAAAQCWAEQCLTESLF